MDEHRKHLLMQQTDDKLVDHHIQVEVTSDLYILLKGFTDILYATEVYPHYSSRIA